MTDAELIRLPTKDDKYAAYRAAVEWGIARGLVKRPASNGERQVSENRRESMKQAQAIRLAKTNLASSKYYEKSSD